jgi:hypothetical protein
MFINRSDINTIEDVLINYFKDEIFNGFYYIYIYIYMLIFNFIIFYYIKDYYCVNCSA